MSNSDQGIPWKTIALFLVVILAGGIAWWKAGGGSEGEGRAMPVACSACGFEGQVNVGPIPASEEWPRECPKCHKKHIYPARPCPHCRKPIPLKDPNAEKFGTPERCPSCGRDYFEP